MNDFKFQIVAGDAYSKVFADMEKTAGKAVGSINKTFAFSNFDKALRLDTVAEGFRTISRETLKMASSIGVASAPMEALFGIGAAGGILAAGGAIVALGAHWGRLGFEVDKTSTAIGVSTTDLQLFRGAANLAGSSSEVMDETLQGLGKTLQDVFYKRDPQALMVMDKFGISMKRTASGAPDVTSAIYDVADAMSKIDNPYTRQTLAESLHIPAESIQFLMKGADALRANRDEQARIGLQTPEMIEQQKEFAKMLFETEAGAKALALSFGNYVGPVLKSTVQEFKAIEGLWDALFGGASRNPTGSAIEPIAALAGWGGEAHLRGAMGAMMNNLGSAGTMGGQVTPEQRALMAKLEAEHGLPSGMLTGIYGAESSFGRNTGMSSAGASGNFQWEPGTAARYGVKVGDFNSEADGAARYLQDLHAQRGSWKGALYGYNGVVNNVDKGEKYVNDVARNSGSDALKIELHIKGAPQGMTATATTAASAWVPTRVSYAMPTTATP